MELVKRKRLRLKEYDYSQNGMYFVTICTNERECRFNKIVGEHLCVLPNNPHEIIERWLLEIENKFCNAIIDKYIIMPNHIHFILQIENAGGHIGPPLQENIQNNIEHNEKGLQIENAGGHIGPPLQEMVQWYKTQTTNAYIRGVKAGLYAPFNKKLWQRSYYEHIIRNEKTYQEIWQYIDSNVLLWEKDEFFI